MDNKDSFFDLIRTGNLAEVTALITAQPDLVHTQDDRGSTPLILATYYGNESITKALVEHGAKIDAIDASGNTALMGVCFKGNEAIAEFLLSQGANANAINGMEATPLIYAAMFNQLGIVKLLLANNADKTIKDNGGKTALDHAVSKSFDAICEVLRTSED